MTGEAPGPLGAESGGHKAIHSELGTLEDFKHLISTAGGAGIEIGADIAFQCTPDHHTFASIPSVPQAAPDGSIQYAENPAQEVQDIYPFHFDSVRARRCRKSCADVMNTGLAGRAIFRVDNPHTKPFPFWKC